MNRSLTALAGAAFALLMPIAFLTVNPPDSKESAAKINAYWSSSSNRAHLITGMVLLCVAAIAWVVFTASLRERLRSPFARNVVPSAVAVTAALLGLIAVMVGAIAVEVSSESAPVPTDFVRYLPNIGYYAMTFLAMPLAGVTIAAISADGRRHGWLPGWFGIVGYVVAATQLVAFIFFPMFLLFLWVLGLSAVLAFRRQPATVAEPAATPAVA